MKDRHRLTKTCLLIVCVVMLFSAISPAAPLASASAPAATPPTASVPLQAGAAGHYFPETGHYVPTAFYGFWSGHGGLPAFGYPLTEAFEEKSPTDGKTYLTQYFERARFEHHPEFAGTPYEVELGHLGSEKLGGQSQTRVTPFASSAQSAYFPETGHSLANGFKYFWENNGGLTVFGYPITQEFRENGLTVQYFERARFEYHPELKGTRYEVLLTLLGREKLEDRGWPLPAVATAGLSPAVVSQGRTSTVLVRSDKPVSAQVNYAGSNVAVAGDGTSCLALLPVESYAGTGRRAVTVVVTDELGTARTFNLQLTVVAAQFPIQRFPVPDDRQSLLDPTLDQQEWDLVQPFYAEVTPSKLWQGPFVVPVTGAEVSTEFGSRRAYNDGPVNSYHDAIDLAIDEGTPVQSDAAGRVVLARRLQVRGNCVIIDHGLGLHTAYFHLSSIDVKEGDIVQKGQVIGKVGNTGLSTGPHLHWEVRIGTVAVDPMQWVNQPIP
ncbi:MAG: M23 family metallopeptidase [Chloroflexi bacterium]|nr:M23 family metallopeptidase [Chloroflexota bacterium]